MLQREKKSLASFGRKQFSFTMCRKKFVRDMAFSKGCQKDHRDISAWERLAAYLPGK